MDELDQLAEQPNLDVRRAINTLSLEFTVENRKGFKKLRESLLEALRADQELHELQIKVPGHAKLLDVAVDPPEATAGGLGRAVDLGVIDAIIEPSQTRRELARAIAGAPQLKGNHANIPL